MVTKQNSVVNDFSAVIRQLTTCADICEASAAALQEETSNDFRSVIQFNKDCAITCLRGAYLLESGAQSGLQFLEVCEEICMMCEEENSQYDNDHCKNASQACLNCIKVLQEAEDKS